MFVAWRWPSRFAAIDNALGEAGEQMQRIACGLTLTVTVPILGLVSFGLLGLIIGLLVGILFGVGLINAAFQKRPE